MPAFGFVVLAWPVSGGAVSSVQVMADTGFGAHATGVSGDGATLIGFLYDQDGNKTGCTWNPTTGNYTTLPAVGSVVTPCEINQDGTHILGNPTAAHAGPALWISRVGAALPMLPGADNAAIPTDLFASSRHMSSDGSIILGQSTTPAGSPQQQGVLWTGGVAAAVTGGMFDEIQVAHLSADGSTLDGLALSISFTPFYNQSGTPHDLDTGAGQTLTYWLRSAGSLIWGRTGGNAWGYWDGLGGAGTWHAVNTGVQAVTTLNDAAETATVAVGYGPGPTFPTDGENLPLKITGTTVAVLDTPVDGYGGEARACSADGTLVAGISYDADGTPFPALWTADGVLHLLPMPANTTLSHMHSIARAGGMIVGLADASSPVVPDATADARRVYLRWSDDGGHSFGNPVGVSMGAVGEYLTSHQWQRLGMGRRRVFEIFWSGTTATALQGAWIDVTPAQS